MLVVEKDHCLVAEKVGSKEILKVEMMDTQKVGSLVDSLVGKLVGQLVVLMVVMKVGSWDNS
jgi:hypothetical protein